MRKTRNILLFILAFVFGSAFAITDAQKEAFVGAVDATVNGDNPEVFKTTVETASKLAEVAPISAWAQESPLEFYDWIKEKNNRYIWTVRIAINKVFDVESVLDAVINDFANTHLTAENDKSYYKSLKAKGFSIVVDEQTLKLSNSKIFSLGKKHADAEIFDFVPEAFLTDKFLDCVKIIEQSEQPIEVVYNACQKIERIFFGLRKTDPIVKANWESFQADSNEIFMAYYKSQKIKTLKQTK